MLERNQIIEFAVSIGAVKCGIAPIERFSDAPKGFHPLDIYQKARSVIVYLVKMPDDTVVTSNPIPYTTTSYLLYNELDKMGLKICRHLEIHGKNGVLIPADTPYLYWDNTIMHGKGILSLRHAAYNSGLGIIGRSNLLITPEYGNMVYIGAVITDCELEPDEPVTGFDCPPKCRICLDDCPKNALDGRTVNQKLCREFSFYKNERGFDIYDCNICRKNCILRTGSN